MAQQAREALIASQRAFSGYTTSDFRNQIRFINTQKAKIPKDQLPAFNKVAKPILDQLEDVADLIDERYRHLDEWKFDPTLSPNATALIQKTIQAFPGPASGNVQTQRELFLRQHMEQGPVSLDTWYVPVLAKYIRSPQEVLQQLVLNFNRSYSFTFRFLSVDLICRRKEKEVEPQRKLESKQNEGSQALILI